MTQNDDRPFLISSGDRVIEMDGGEINVLRETSQTGARTVLTVRQGQAKVYRKAAPRKAWPRDLASR
ncbi:MAG: hypothetical protein WDN45_19205 [Caulobacteraceae bacterium]